MSLIHVGSEILPCHASPVTIVALLKVFSKTRDLEKAVKLHAEILQRGFIDKDVSVGNCLVSLYCKCGAFTKAQEVFDDLPCRNIISWNALIAGYSQHGHGKEALNYFELMQQNGLSPNAITFVSALKACAIIQALPSGEVIHGEIARRGLLSDDVILGNALIHMYVKCGELAKAHNVLCELPFRNVVSWSSLISGFIHYGYEEEAMLCFAAMKNECIQPNAVTYACILKACGSLGQSIMGQELHVEIVIDGCFKEGSFVGTALVDMYAKNFMFKEAWDVFNKLSIQDTVSWTTLMSGYVEHGLGEEALQCFQLMEASSISADDLTFAYVLKSCDKLCKGQQMHAKLLGMGVIKDKALAAALMDMYVNFGAFENAQKVLDDVPYKDPDLFNVLITGYAQKGYCCEALACFQQMHQSNISPNTTTYISILKACGDAGRVDKVQEVHDKIVKMGFIGADNVLGDTLVDAYAKCNELVAAQVVFDGLPVHDVVSWNILITGYVKIGLFEEGLECFKEMQIGGFSMDGVTCIAVLITCGSTDGCVSTVHQLHSEIARIGLLAKDNTVGNALLDVYCKHGDVAKAQEIFDDLSVLSVISWNALMAGYAQIGNHKAVFQLFESMTREGKSPNLMTFTILLNTCSHSGLFEECYRWVEMMDACYYTVLTLEQCTCIVDLFGRAGNLNKVISIIEKMPFLADVRLWLAVLSACRQSANLYIGKWACDHALQLDCNDNAVYVSMKNIMINHS